MIFRWSSISKTIVGWFKRFYSARGSRTSFTDRHAKQQSQKSMMIKRADECEVKSSVTVHSQQSFVRWSWGLSAVNIATCPTLIYTQKSSKNQHNRDAMSECVRCFNYARRCTSGPLVWCEVRAQVNVRKESKKALYCSPRSPHQSTNWFIGLSWFPCLAKVAIFPVSAQLC